jgi:uncharacterized cupin superfamily protein
MPTSLVKTPRDERLWQKAKDIAEEAGHAENYAYIMGVYKKMNPDRFDKSAAFSTSRAMYLREEIARALQRPLPAARKSREVGAVVHELLAFLGGQEFADGMTDRVTQGIVRAAPRTASFSTIDPKVHDAIDMHVDAALRAIGQSETTLRALRRSNYPPTVAELDGVGAGLSKAVGHVDPAKGMAARVASRHLRAYYDPGHRSDTGYLPGNVHQEAPYRGVGSQVPEPRDRNGHPVPVPQYGMLKIPGYEWHDKSESFHRNAAMRRSAKAKKLRVYDFDETLAVASGSITITHADGEKTTINSATFAYFKPSEGDKLDFGAFNDVNNPRKIKKNWEAFVRDTEDPDVDVVILTARPKGSASAVSKFLKSEGIKGVNVVALQSSDPYDKARWIDKAIEDRGYRDVRFVDDSTKNANAVAEHGKRHSESGIQFESVHSPHPHSDDEFIGAALKGSWSSDDPTIAISEYKPKTPTRDDGKSDGGKSKPSAWWESQSPEFKKQYCNEHPASKYCGRTASFGGIVAAKDPNDALKKEISGRAQKSRNGKVRTYVQSFLKKLNAAGPAAGIWVEQVEADFDDMVRKPQGLLEDFDTEDFDELHLVLFGYRRKGGRKATLAHW